MAPLVVQELSCHFIATTLMIRDRIEFHTARIRDPNILQ